MDMLLEGVVRAALRRDAPNVAAIGVVGEGLLVPSLDGIRRVGEDDVELLELVVLEESGIGQGVAPHDLELLNAVHEHVHSCNRRGDHVDLLPIELQGAVLLALVLEVKCAVEEQPLNRTWGHALLSRLGVHDHRHELHHGAVGVELRCHMATVVCEFLNEVFVGVTQLVVGNGRVVEFVLGIVLDEVD